MPVDPAILREYASLLHKGCRHDGEELTPERQKILDRIAELAPLVREENQRRGRIWQKKGAAKVKANYSRYPRRQKSDLKNLEAWNELRKGTGC
jgi:hypothetical protein